MKIEIIKLIDEIDEINRFKLLEYINSYMKNDKNYILYGAQNIISINLNNQLIIKFIKN